jgi:outer membrane protein TolC
MFTTKLKIANLQSQLKIKEENLALSTESMEIYQSRFKEGQESTFNINLEEVNLQILENEHETNKKQLWVYWLNYLKASGQLTILWK